MKSFIWIVKMDKTQTNANGKNTPKNWIRHDQVMLWFHFQPHMKSATIEPNYEFWQLLNSLKNKLLLLKHCIFSTKLDNNRNLFVKLISWKNYEKLWTRKNKIKKNTIFFVNDFFVYFFPASFSKYNLKSNHNIYHKIIDLKRFLLFSLWFFL